MSRVRRQEGAGRGLASPGRSLGKSVAADADTVNKQSAARRLWGTQGAESEPFPGSLLVAGAALVPPGDSSVRVGLGD